MDTIALNNRKYAALPDLDSAPDIYETPALTEDNSTAPASTLRTHSDLDFEDDLDDNDTGISHSRLRIQEARSRFGPAGVDATGVDFSDRVDTKRKSYITSSRRRGGHRRDSDAGTENGDETLERMIVRLKREVEEAKELYGKKLEEQGEEGDEEEQLESLGLVLDALSRPAGVSVAPRDVPPSDPEAAPTDPSTALPPPTNATYSVTYAPGYEQTHALAKVSEFDARLQSLEATLGANASLGLDLDANGMPRAVIPTLDVLQRQVATLTQASTATLDTISRRVRTLAAETEMLTKARREAREADLTTLDPGNVDEKVSTEAEAKVNALYGTLATIESLAPILPPLLDRLRSLRTIHADAANAAEVLARIEKQQADMTAELKQWREGLTTIEGAIKAGTETMQGNTQVMETWVKDLEGRIAKFEI